MGKLAPPVALQEVLETQPSRAKQGRAQGEALVTVGMVAAVEVLEVLAAQQPVVRQGPEQVTPGVEATLETAEQGATTRCLRAASTLV